jgi:prepilin-type N-terminal cleavage/methylation domain-containing protein
LRHVDCYDSGVAQGEGNFMKAESGEHASGGRATERELRPLLGLRGMAFDKRIDEQDRPCTEARTDVSGLRRRAAQRGVSLIELMVVVVLIAIFASLAAPSILRSTEDRRAFEKATEVAQLMQEARGRALATGAAQMVAMTNVGGGEFLLFQAMYNKQPSPSCLTYSQWTNDVKIVNNASAVTSLATIPAAGPSVVLVDGVNLKYAADSDLQSSFYLANAATGSTVAYLCFTPGGRVYYFGTAANLLASNGAPLSGAFEIYIGRYPHGVHEGLMRSVMIDGTDVARLRSF